MRLGYILEFRLCGPHRQFVHGSKSTTFLSLSKTELQPSSQYSVASLLELSRPNYTLTLGGDHKGKRDHSQNIRLSHATCCTIYLVLEQLFTVSQNLALNLFLRSIIPLNTSAFCTRASPLYCCTASQHINIACRSRE
jgi:hypothetical protein